MREYRERIADTLLADALAARGAVLVQGPKWCGKTTTCARIAGSVVYMQDPMLREQYAELAEMNPSYLLSGDVPRMIDEWQLSPKLWDAVRFEVDRRDEFGQFILTGSAVPPDSGAISHTGTGRISRITMSTMTLRESGESDGSVSLGALFGGETEISGTNALSLGDLAFLICRGGWPRAVGLSDKTALRQARDYYDALTESDMSRVDGVRRDTERVRALMRSYARNICTQAKSTVLRDDMRANDTDALGEDTVVSYVNALKKLFVVSELRAWNPNLRSKTAVRTSDTRYFVDPSIAAAALGLGPDDLMRDPITFGFMFENLCVRDLRVYADMLDGNLYHYRDASGLECDAVIHLRGGKWAAVEIKLGAQHIEEAAKHLAEFAGRIDTSRMNAPSFLMVLSGTAPYAYRRKDGVYVVPAGCLKY